MQPETTSPQLAFTKALCVKVRAGNEDSAKLLREILTGIVKNAPHKYLAMLGDAMADVGREVYRDEAEMN